MDLRQRALGWSKDRVGDDGLERIGRMMPRPAVDWLVGRTHGEDPVVTEDFDVQGQHLTFSGSRRMVRHAQKHEGLERRICRAALHSLAPGGVGIDVGTACGWVSLMMAKAVGPTGHVLSIEADPWMARMTARNARQNGCDRAIDLVEAFAGAKTDGQFVSVDDEVARRGYDRVDFLKIDVDGGDVDVLRGALQTIERFHPVVVIELTVDEEAIYELLHARYRWLGDMKGQQVTRGQWPTNMFAFDRPVEVLERAS